MGDMIKIKCRKCPYEQTIYSGAGMDSKTRLFYCPKCYKIEEYGLDRDEMDNVIPGNCTKCGQILKPFSFDVEGHNPNKQFWDKMAIKYKQMGESYKTKGSYDPNDFKEENKNFGMGEIAPSVILKCPECKSKDIEYSWDGLWD